MQRIRLSEDMRHVMLLGHGQSNYCATCSPTSHWESCKEGKREDRMKSVSLLSNVISNTHIFYKAQHTPSLANFPFIPLFICSSISPSPCQHTSASCLLCVSALVLPHRRILSSAISTEMSLRSN